MDWQPWAITALSFGCAISGWFMRELWGAVKELRKDLQMLKDSLPETYSRRDDVKDMFQQILSRLEQLHEELKHKADK